MPFGDAVQVRQRDERISLLQCGFERREAAAEIAAGQGAVRSPGAADARSVCEVRREFGQRMLGQLAVSGELAAEHIEQRRASAGVELEHVIARDSRDVGAAIVIQRAHAAVAPQHVGGGERLRQIFARDGAQVVDFIVRDGGLLPRFDRYVGGANQAELAVKRNHEDDAFVAVLQQVGMLTGVDARHHDVAAFDMLNALGRGLHACDAAQHPHHPRPGSVDDGARMAG